MAKLNARVMMRTREKPEISLIIPVFNEASQLEHCITRVKRTLQKLDISFEIIIAEDGSADGTARIAKELTRQDPAIRYFHCDDRLGRGEALRRTFKVATGDILIYTDADLSTHLGHLRDLMEAIDNGADIAIGSRLIKRAFVKRAFVREIASRTYNLLVRLLLGSPIHDHQCGFKAFKRQPILKLIDEVQDKHWFFDTELIVSAAKQGYVISEIPVRWTQAEKSKVRLSTDVRQMGSCLLKLFWTVRTKRGQSTKNSRKCRTHAH